MSKTVSIPLLLLLSPPFAPFPPQEPRYAIRFEGGSVTWDEYHLELARRYRGRPIGRQALDHLVSRVLFQREAARRGLAKDPEAVASRLALIESRLKKNGKKLGPYLRGRGLSRKEFDEYLQLSIWTEEITRRDMGLEAGAAIRPEMIRLWVKEAERRQGVVRDPAKLPSQVCARIGDREISLVELGRTMDRNLVAKDRRAVLKQMAAFRLLAREAERRGIRIEAADIEERLAKIAEETAARPEMKKAGLDLEALLHAQGRTLEDLKHEDAFLARVYAAKLGGVLFPDEAVRKAFRGERGKWLDKVGPARLAWRIFLRTGPGRSTEEAKKILRDLARKIAGIESFRVHARRFGEGSEARVAKGRLGWLHRAEEGWDPRMLEALFALRRGEVSAPVEEFGGVSLLFVSDLREAPPEDRILPEIREFLFRDWLRGRIREARIVFYAKDGRPLPAEGG